MLSGLISAVAAIPPSDPENGTGNRLMRGFGAQYRDEYDALQTHRHSRQKHNLEPAVRLSGREKSFNFVVCSAKLANTGYSNFVQTIGAFAFFDLRDVLETTCGHYERNIWISLIRMLSVLCRHAHPISRLHVSG
jgi:hypothetical protein